jgi:hypothetical protein
MITYHSSIIYYDMNAPSQTHLRRAAGGGALQVDLPAKEFVNFLLELRKQQGQFPALFLLKWCSLGRPLCNRPGT